MQQLLVVMLANALFIISNIALPKALQANATFTIITLDGPGEGFNDPSPAAPEGGNAGTTIGEQRLNAFEHAANILGAQIDSPVNIRVGASFDALQPCTPSFGVLGQAGPNTLHRNFVGAPLMDTWYVQALANSHAGSDLHASNDISAEFSSIIGTPDCLPTLGWYYGLDANPPAGKLDFVTVLLHELGHGLGFLSLVALNTGAKFQGFDDAYMRHLEDHTTGKSFPQMTDSERAAAHTATGNLHWTGPNVVTGSGGLNAGRHPSGHVQMYAPGSIESGSSVSHYDTALSPDELMEPFHIGPDHDVNLTLELLKDLGWVANGSPLTDTIPPAKIADLKLATSAQTNVTLNWTAPGDDDDTGAATSYDMRFSIKKFTDADWDTLTQVSGEPAPMLAGSPQNTIVNNLLCGKSYFFAIKTLDEEGNTSALSNIATAKTAACNKLAVNPTKLPAAEQNVPYNSGIINITNGAPPYNLQILTNTSTDLSYDPAAQSFTGTPTAPGTFKMSGIASDSVGSERKVSFTGKIYKPVEITTKVVKAGKVSVPYNVTFKAKNGVKPYEWEITTSTSPSPVQGYDAKTGKTTLLGTVQGFVDLNVKVKSLTGGTSSRTLPVEFK